MIYFKDFKVGVTERRDTYTNSLGFINIKNSDGTWKFKKSYDNWKEHNNVNTELNYTNEPIEGFVVNEGAGGYYRRSNDGREPKTRIYDPRGFEIEITLDNFYKLTKFGIDEGGIFKSKLFYLFSGASLTLAHESEFDQYIVKVNSVKPITKEHELVEGYTYYKDESLNESYVYVGKMKFRDSDYLDLVKHKQTQRFAKKIDDENYIISEDLTKSKFKFYKETEPLKNINLYFLENGAFINEPNKNNNLPESISRFEGLAYTSYQSSKDYKIDYTHHGLYGWSEAYYKTKIVFYTKFNDVLYQHKVETKSSKCFNPKNNLIDDVHFMNKFSTSFETSIVNLIYETDYDCDIVDSLTKTKDIIDFSQHELIPCLTKYLKIKKIKTNEII